jgi:hypothetical protein
LDRNALNITFRGPRQILDVSRADLGMWNVNYLSAFDAMEGCMHEMDFGNNKLEILLLAPANPVTMIIRMLSKYENTGICKGLDWTLESET